MNYLWINDVRVSICVWGVHPFVLVHVNANGHCLVFSSISFQMNVWNKVSHGTQTSLYS